MEMLSMRLETDRHLGEEEIEKYSLGDISGEEASRFEEHLLICESCQNRVTESDRYVSAMRCASAQIRREERRTEKRKWSFPRLIPALAALAAVALTAAIGLQWVTGTAREYRNRGVEEPAFALNLVATRGSGIEARAPTGRTLVLQLDLAGLPPEPSFRLEMVDGLGRRVWQGAVIPQDSKAVVSVPQMPRGVYFVRTSTPSGKLLREFGLVVESR
jgi:hypothetical protein